jgi:hypothetical protein
MNLDRDLADEKIFRDLPVRPSFGKLPKNFRFATGKRREKAIGFRQGVARACGKSPISNSVDDRDYVRPR